ncbi:MAG: hypothetical protein ACYDD2_13105 [Candidatus Acidiferrales bacterium]
MSATNSNPMLDNDAALAAQWKSPAFDARYRRDRRLRLVQEFGHEHAGPAGHSGHRPWLDSYFADKGQSGKIRRGDPSRALPKFLSFEERIDYAREWGAEAARIEQAKCLAAFGLSKKAARLPLCGILAKRVDCRGTCRTKYFDRFGCNLRYCTVCGERGFRALFSKYMGYEPIAQTIIERVRKQGREPVIAKLDFTTPSDGKMPAKAYIRKFHRDLWRFRRALEREFGLSKEDFGILGCDEFGGQKSAEHPTGNWNLHRHCVYVGPRLPQSKALKELSALWSKIRGERSFVSIKRARSFAEALGHALKYPAKFLGSSTPERLAQLEKVFDGTRRVSASGAFYGVKIKEDSGKAKSNGKCPKCDGQLVGHVPGHGGGFVVANELRKEGRIDLAEARREESRKKVFADGVRAP